jgi:hypothetical protein
MSIHGTKRNNEYKSLHEIIDKLAGDKLLKWTHK